jgi:SNW domain-containing protein 1
MALEKVTSGKIAAARPTTVALKDSANSQYIRYTPASTSDQGKQRIIKMSEVQEDPLEPPRFKHKKIPRAPDGPPPPVMQSPPRRVTPQEAKDWQIPPCISNWKNNKGYTIALDKRLAADGRGLQDVSTQTMTSRMLYLTHSHLLDPHQRQLCQILGSTVHCRSSRKRGSARASSDAAKDCAKGKGCQGGESTTSCSACTRRTSWYRASCFRWRRRFLIRSRTPGHEGYWSRRLWQ